MFLNDTVFILGAGASWHYGYPTGEMLVRKAVLRSRTIAEYFRRSMNSPINTHRPDYLARRSTSAASVEQIRGEWDAALKETVNFAERLQQVNPLVIDYFLGQNPELQPIGKLMIALIILECEAKFLQQRGNINRRELLLESPNPGDRAHASQIALQFCKDDWYRFILHKLVTDCDKSSDLLKNSVHFVTFNYDVSLECALDQRLRSISLFQRDDIEKFLGPGRVFHIYGKVRAQSTQNDSINIDLLKSASEDISTHVRYQQDHDLMGQHLKQLLDVAYTASEGIRVISPSDKDLDVNAINAAKEVINDARCIYILGYGFDEKNSARLDLFRTLQLATRNGKVKNEKVILFTNYGDINRINKKASSIFFDNFDNFLPNEPAIKGSPFGDYYCEKSVRNVYDALELDFDSLEEQFGLHAKI